MKGGIELEEFSSACSVHLNAQGCLETRPKVVTDKVSNIAAWTDAFLIYSSIYMRKHVSQGPDLLHYMSIIRDAARRHPGFSWRAYDEQFRLRQTVKFQSWSKINPDLWLRVMAAPSVSPAAVQRNSMFAHIPSATRNARAPMLCLDFNKGFCRWPKCKYIHICSSCKANTQW